MAVILGIDPGSRVCGYGIIELRGQRLGFVASGCIRMANLPFVDRLQTIYDDLCAIIQRYEPSQAALEEVFMGKNASSALKLGQARGAAIVACGSHGLAIAEYSTRRVKQALVGTGRADKAQIQHMVAALLSLSALPQEDAADALAVAICHAHTQLGQARKHGMVKPGQY